MSMQLPHPTRMVIGSGHRVVCCEVHGRQPPAGVVVRIGVGSQIAMVQYAADASTSIFFGTPLSQTSISRMPIAFAVVQLA
jgi:hypothetical protein